MFEAGAGFCDVCCIRGGLHSNVPRSTYQVVLLVAWQKKINVLTQKQGVSYEGLSGVVALAVDAIFFLILTVDGYFIK